jgi:hypothetical protein
MLDRRTTLVALLSCMWQSACSQTAPDEALAKNKPLTNEEQRWRRKFGGLKGGELFVDAFGEKRAVMIYDERGLRFYASSTLSPRNNSKHSYGAEFGVPITLRATWRAGEWALTSGDPNGLRVVDRGYEGGTIVGDVTVPVAERIPGDLLDELRENGGGFRLKLRLHDDGLLIGWDIRRGLSFLMTGGDFKEARIVYDGYGNSTKSRLELGWYIHPKTRQKIETDF